MNLKANCVVYGLFVNYNIIYSYDTNESIVNNCSNKYVYVLSHFHSFPPLIFEACFSSTF